MKLSLELLNRLYSFVCFLPFALLSVKSVSQAASGDELKPLPSVSVHNFVHYSSEGCILYGETRGVDKISLREICLGGHGEIRDVDTFLIGGQFLDTTEPSIFLFFSDPQPVWVYTISQQPVPLAHGADMDNSEWERLFNRVGGQTMVMAASGWLASSSGMDSLTQSAMNGSAAIGIELAAILGARLLFEAFGPDEDEQGWDYVWQELFLESADNPLMSLAINPALSEFVLRYLIHGLSAPLLLGAYINVGYDLPQAFRNANTLGRLLSSLTMGGIIFLNAPSGSFGRYGFVQTVAAMAVSYFMFAESYEAHGLKGSWGANTVYSLIQFALAKGYLGFQAR